MIEQRIDLSYELTEQSGRQEESVVSSSFCSLVLRTSYVVGNQVRVFSQTKVCVCFLRARSRIGSIWFKWRINVSLSELCQVPGTGTNRNILEDSRLANLGHTGISRHFKEISKAVNKCQETKVTALKD